MNRTKLIAIIAEIASVAPPENKRCMGEGLKKARYNPYDDNSFNRKYPYEHKHKKGKKRKNWE